MKKMIVFLSAAVCLCGLVGCGKKGDVSGVETDYGNSALYPDEDMSEAVEVIKEEFGTETWSGFELYSITYTSDERCASEDIEWLNDLAEVNGLDGNYTECIVFQSDFHTPADASGNWNEDTEYTDWQWWLARAEGGDWELVTWGY